MLGVVNGCGGFAFCLVEGGGWGWGMWREGSFYNVFGVRR